MEDMRDSVSDYLKCPICFEIPKDKMFQCRNGHRFCEDCYKQFREKYCPQCKDHIPKNPIRCKAVEELLDSFGLEFPCQFQGTGCKIKKDRRDIGEHNSSCKHDFEKFGPLENVCGLFGFNDCSFVFNRGSIDEALAHFQQEHKMRSLKALLSKPFKVQYEDFKKIFSASEMTIFTPLIFDQRWWGHNFIYIIVIRFNPHDKTLQFVPFYLTHGFIVWNGSKGFSEEVKFTLDLVYSSATVQPHLLLNRGGRTLKDATYIAFPLNSEMSFNKETPTPIHSYLQIQISKENTPQPPENVRHEDGVTDFTTFKPTDILLTKRWPPLIREVCSIQGYKNWDQVGWISWKDFEECRHRFTSFLKYEWQKFLVCRANINKRWLIGTLNLNTMGRNSFQAHFKSPSLLQSEESYSLGRNFEVLYEPPNRCVWAKWKDAKGMEAVGVHDEDKSLLICKLMAPGIPFIGALEKNMELGDRHDDISVLVFSKMENKKEEHKCWTCDKGYPCHKRHNKREH